MTNSNNPDEGSSDTQSEAPKPRVFTSPVQFLAFGFGSGLVPRGPGTAGTLMAVPLFLLAADWQLPVYTAVLVLAAVLGIWICGAASKQLGVHDHGGIVWDEFVGFWITMWAVPVSWTWIIAGFLVFRVLTSLNPGLSACWIKM